MRRITKREIEKRAVMQIINHFEQQIESVIKQSVIEFEKINELKKIQGLHTKKRIDEDCIRNAIKHIYGKRHSDLPKKGRKVIKEKKEEIEVT
jgi:hypothetical protein